MSWHFSRALVEEFSAANCSDGEPFALSKLANTADVFSCNGKMTESSIRSQSGMTCEPLMGTHGEAVLTWFLGGFPVRTFPPQEKEQELPESEAGCGDKWHESFAKFCPLSRSWKIRQLWLLADLDASLEIWPKWGIMHDGECWERGMLVHVTDAIDSGFVPTVLTSEATGPGLHGNGSHNFRTWFRENSTERRLPLHGEIMMLWPESWAIAGKPLEMDKFRQWLGLHGIPSLESPEISQPTK